MFCYLVASFNFLIPVFRFVLSLLASLSLCSRIVTSWPLMREALARQPQLIPAHQMRRVFCAVAASVAHTKPTFSRLTFSDAHDGAERAVAKCCRGGRSKTKDGSATLREDVLITKSAVPAASAFYRVVNRA